MKEEAGSLKRLPIKKADILLALILSVTGIFLLLIGRLNAGENSRLWVRGYQDGVLVFEYPADAQVRTTIHTPDKTGINVVVIDDNKVYVDSADCPGKDCVKRGIITRSGEEIICLPHRLVIRIEGGEGIDVMAD